MVLADVLRTDRHLHRPLPAISEQGLAVKVLARQHQEAIWARQPTVNRLRSLLVEYYPQRPRRVPGADPQGRVGGAAGRADTGRGRS